MAVAVVIKVTSVAVAVVIRVISVAVAVVGVEGITHAS